jgi:hypothetical protein
MIDSVGAHSHMHQLLQAQQAQASSSASASAAADLFGSDADADDAVSSTTGDDNSSSNASGPPVNLLSSVTLASLLGLQMVNGQAQGGATSAQLNLPQLNLGPSMDPTAMLNNPTLQAMQSIGV